MINYTSLANYIIMNSNHIYIIMNSNHIYINMNSD